jgi:heptosyltransferase-2
MPRFNHEEIRKILIIRWGGLGDLALCSAIIDDLAHAMPDASLHLHTESPWQPLFNSDPRLDQVWSYNIRRSSALAGIRWYLRLLREQDYDLIVDLQCNDRSWLLLSIARLLGRAPKWLVSRKSGFPYSFTNRPHSTDVPAIELLRMPLELLGIKPCADRPILFHSQEDEHKACSLLGPLANQSFGVVVPGCSAAGANKRWGIGNYVELSRQWLASGEVEHIVILGAADEADVCASVATGVGPQALNLCGKTELAHILPLVKRSKAIVSNDTGIAHISAAAGVPMVVICGPTLAVRVKPLGDHVTALQIDPNCFKVKPTEECMARLKADEVLRTLQSIC